MWLGVGLLDVSIPNGGELLKALNHSMVSLLLPGLMIDMVGRLGLGTLWSSTGYKRNEEHSGVLHV